MSGTSACRESLTLRSTVLVTRPRLWWARSLLWLAPALLYGATPLITHRDRPLLLVGAPVAWC